MSLQPSMLTNSVKLSRSVGVESSNPCLCADILGKELRIFTTTIPTKHRLVTLMHDHVYRLSVAWQNVSYNQPAHPGFYLGSARHER